MEEASNVCCLCGDIGFPDKLFQCLRCICRFQHSYCSNHYRRREQASEDGVCDWCLSEDRRRHSNRRPPPGRTSADQHAISEDGGGSRGRNTGGSSTSRHSGRRYKLLKDVLC